jgi:hypothetical protein
MGATTKLHRLNSGLAAHSMRIDVMELGEDPLVTAAASFADEGASPAVAEPYRTPDRRRDVPGPAGRTAAGSRPVGRGELPFGKLREQYRKRAIDDLRHVSGRNRVSQHVLRQP